MPAHDDLAMLSRLMEDELTERILPFWAERTVDEKQGGFVGRMTADGRVAPQASKALVLNARILWTFSVAAQRLGTERYRRLAQRAYEYLIDNFWDDENDGFFWMLHADGTPEDTHKQVYAQAFGIYALVEYYALTDVEAALQYANRIFDLLEAHTHDRERGGYFETYRRDWSPLDQMRLSERDPVEKRSMNTHLHVMEAYTSLQRVHPDDDVENRLRALVKLFLRCIVDNDNGHLINFFDENWNVRSNVISFGHDIEASWLLTEAAEVLNAEKISEKAKNSALNLVEATLGEGLDEDHGVIEEADPKGVVDDDRHGWPQAEAIVGFVNAYQLTGATRFLKEALASWEFIERFLLDRDHGEWFLKVSQAGQSYLNDDKVGPWKGPYHSARACFEVMQRCSKMTDSSHVSDKPSRTVDIHS